MYVLCLLYIDLTYQENYFSMMSPGIGRYLVAMALQGVLFIVLLFLVELQCVRTLKRMLGSLCWRHRKVRLIGPGHSPRGAA